MISMIRRCPWRCFCPNHRKSPSVHHPPSNWYSVPLTLRVALADTGNRQTIRAAVAPGTATECRTATKEHLRADGIAHCVSPSNLPIKLSKCCLLIAVFVLRAVPLVPKKAESGVVCSKYGRSCSKISFTRAALDQLTHIRLLPGSTHPSCSFVPAAKRIVCIVCKYSGNNRV